MTSGLSPGARPCTLERVFAHVVGQVRLGGIAAGLRVDALSLAVVEGRRREVPREPEKLGDVAVGIEVARVRDRDLAEELLRRLARVLRVDREKRDLLALLDHLLLEERE